MSIPIKQEHDSARFMACPWCGHESYITDKEYWLQCLNCLRWRPLNTHPHLDPKGIVNAEIALSYMIAHKLA